MKELEARGHIVLEPNKGELASGLCGEGRMQEPEQLCQAIVDQLKKKADLKGKSILISAGPTYEAVDPVRFIGNYSSGLMGYELANECAERGASVTLVSGPTHLTVNHPNIEKVNVESAKQMFDACTNSFQKADIAIMAAAVADFRPEIAAKEKIKKSNNLDSIKLVPTTDILKALGESKTKKQFLVGFALETENEIENAKTKLQNKKLDFIVLNSLKNEKAGFGKNTNQVSIIDKKMTVTDFEAKTKKEVAVDIVNKIVELNP